jgi:hypothetical protein
MSWLAVGSCVAVAALAAGAATPPPAAADRQLLRGVALTPRWDSLSGEQQAAELDAARALGATMVRLGVAWPMLQPTAGDAWDGAFASAADGIIAAARERGLAVDLMIGGGTPCWAVEAHHCKIGSIAPPRDDGAFAAMAAWAARRWGGSLAAIELGNEPNNPVFWKGTVKDYVRMACAGYRAIKDVAPAVVVGAPALALSDARWLRRFYAAGGGACLDAVTVHPYSIRFNGPGAGFLDPLADRPFDEIGVSFRQGLEALHGEMLRAGDTHQMWITEFGYASCPVTNGFCAADGDIARWDAEAFEQAAQWPWVGAMVYFSLRDDVLAALGPGDWSAHFGLLSADFARKPQADSVAQAWQGEVSQNQP